MALRIHNHTSSCYHINHLSGSFVTTKYINGHDVKTILSF